MKLIKFRFWNEKEKTYHDYRDYFISQNGDAVVQNGYTMATLAEPPIVEQFTGLKDKNGKEIYEGDLFMDDGELYVIKQPSGYAGLYLCHINDDYGDDLNHYYFDQMEVIGNIHENGGLLNEDNN